MRKIILNFILAVLVFLAISSGLTKIFLMQQDVDFFGQYGFTDSILIIYGVIQVLGGVLLVLSKTRIIGAIIVAITFLTSLVALIIAGNISMAIITLICISLLAILIKQSINSKNTNSDASKV